MACIQITLATVIIAFRLATSDIPGTPNTTTAYIATTTTPFPVTTTISVFTTSYNINSNITPLTSTRPVFQSSEPSTSNPVTASKIFYHGFLHLNSSSVGSSITTKDLNDWLVSRTNETFNVLDFNTTNYNGKPGAGFKRRKRNSNQYLNVRYTLETNSTKFYESFKSTENMNITIGNYTVLKSLLWKNCPCELPYLSGTCEVNDSGEFICSPQVAPTVRSEKSDLKLLALITLVIPVVVIIALIIYFVRRRKKRKIERDILTIQPGMTKNKKIDTMELSMKNEKNKFGFSSINSSNFEYENESIKQGLY